MLSTFLDADVILSSNEHWQELEEKWGEPVDLETEEDMSPSKIKHVFSSLDVRKTTFDSSFLFKKVKKNLRRQMSRRSVLEYKDFLEDLQKGAEEDSSSKQFYYISGQILSAYSVEEICHKIDHIFKSLEKLSSATSTIRQKKPVVPEIVECSISSAGLSFDDTQVFEREKHDSDDVCRYIDEAFEQINSTIVSLASREHLDETVKDSVTTLVRKFSSILNGPMAMRSPRRKRECSEKFKDLAEFWKNMTITREDSKV